MCTLVDGYLSLSAGFREAAIRINTRFKTSKEQNLIAQEDARHNLRLARSAYNDGKQMRSIAILTMIFLPATFVAVSELSMVLTRSTAVFKSWIFCLTFTVQMTLSIFPPEVDCHTD